MTLPGAKLEDRTLIELAVAGDAECFTMLMDRHLPALKRCIASFLPNETDADDLLQDVLFKLWRRLSTFRSESAFRTWMTRVAINEILQFYRRHRSRPACQYNVDLDAFPSRDESPHGSFTRNEATKAVQDAVAALPEMYREVLVLRDLEQLSTEQAAQSLRLTVPAAKTRLLRARLMLSASLQGSKVRGLTRAKRKYPARICHDIGRAA